MPGLDFIGIPLHPLLVHFPIVFSILLPISAIAALVVIRKGTTPRSGWTLPVLLAAALTISSYMATQTGEIDQDKVERVVDKRAIHGHEEAAERFLTLSEAVLLVAFVGFAPRRVGHTARLVATFGALGLIAAGVQVGHSGGKLVYRHGAANAFTNAGTTATSKP